MKVSILSIGDELTSGYATDTNSVWIAKRAREHGADVIEMRTVSDEPEEIAAAITQLAQKSSLLCITGGLGPTQDDVTRHALADAITPGEECEIDPDGIRQIERWYRLSNRSMPKINRCQALRPRGSSLIKNRYGTAPGIKAILGNCKIISMPGVPKEMYTMFESVADECFENNVDNVWIMHTVNTVGLSEAVLAEGLGEMLDRNRKPRLGTSAEEYGVKVRIYANGNPSQAEEEAQSMADEVEKRLNPYSYSRNDMSLAQALGLLLLERGMTISTIESCTGGMVGELLTSTPGSSNYYSGGWVTYSNEMKSDCVGVDENLIKAHGAVSGEVARAMAIGALKHSNSDIAISITGIAGPDGGTADKPVGTVFIGCAMSKKSCEDALVLKRFRFGGGRESIRKHSAQIGLQLARFVILDVVEVAPLLGVKQ